MFVVSHCQLLPVYPPIITYSFSYSSRSFRTCIYSLIILNFFSLFIDHHSTDTAILALISFASFSRSVGSFSPPLFGGHRILFSLSPISSEDI